MQYDPFQQFAFSPFDAAAFSQMQPQQAAQHLAGLGIPSPMPGITTGPNVADFMPGAAPTAAPPMMPGAGAGMAPGAAPGLGQVLQAVQRPQAQAPLMSGGVHGAQKAPDAKVDAGTQSSVAQLLMQLLQARQSPMTVPTLGQLIGR